MLLLAGAPSCGPPDKSDLRPSPTCVPALKFLGFKALGSLQKEQKKAQHINSLNHTTVLLSNNRIALTGHKRSLSLVLFMSLSFEHKNICVIVWGHIRVQQFCITKRSGEKRKDRQR